jgi:hypothetical protein
MQLAFGLSRAIPEHVVTAWGARLIAPADLIHDRQDLQAADDASRDRLARWLDDGALERARTRLRNERLPESDDVTMLVDDGVGTIVGSTRRSGGHVYLAAWLAVQHQSPRAAAELQEAAAADDLTEADELSGNTDCPEGCYVEPDGRCPHGYESAACTLGVI